MLNASEGEIIMAVSIGRDSKINFGTTTVLDMVDYNLVIDAPVLEASVFGSTWNEVYGSSIKSASGSLSGLVNVSDTTGQNILESAVISGTKITDFRLYIDDTNYWASNIVSDSDAGCYFTNYSITSASTDINKVSVNFNFKGEVYRTS